MERIIYWDEHETTLFAVHELTRLIRKAGGECVALYQIDDMDMQSQPRKTIHLITTHTYNSKMNEEISIVSDGFMLKKSNNELWIIGNEHRSILYGIYKYCHDFYGYRWVHPTEEIIVDSKLEREDTFIYEPRFNRRGNIIETVNDPSYISSLIDWGVKNGHNEYFFTFFLWDQIKSAVSPDIQKRDLHITLGGHSLGYLLEQVYKDKQRQDLKQDQKMNFFIDRTEIQDKVINKIIEVCHSHNEIKRISLWPEDVKVDKEKGEGFIASYIQFMERLADAIHLSKLNVEVEHIVYNAGLSWQMLERNPDDQASDKVDILYAYWGRDYSTELDSSHPNQQRALHSLVDWNNEARRNNRSLTVLEYYSDHFMLSNLFPPLLNRINQDLHEYQKLNVHGVLNLIVPIHKKGQDLELESLYPWKWIHHINNYFYSRLVWGEDFDVIKNDYFSLCSDSEAMYEKVIELESVVSKLTKWNVPLFPARVVDPEKISFDMIEGEREEVLRYLKEIDRLVSGWNLSNVDSIMNRLKCEPGETFAIEEMLLIYFAFLKKFSQIYSEKWEV